MKSRHSNFKDRTGEKFKTKDGYEVEIINYESARNCTIRFNDDKNTVLTNIYYSNLKKEKTLNPNHPSVYEKGYFGVGKFKSRSGDNNFKTKYYNVWLGLLTRSYNKNYQEKQPTYKGCTVAEEWHNFQNFAAWYEENYKPETMEGWHLDKDILIKGNKIYSPDNCAFVPREINNLFTKRQNHRGELPIGVKKWGNKFVANCSVYGREVKAGVCDDKEEAFQIYKDAKEKHIKAIAERWKDKIDLKLYNAMIEYRIEITD